MRNFGIECEVESGARPLLDLLGMGGMHEYHCNCYSHCNPHRDGPDWTMHEDCTADGELISRILHYGTSAADGAIGDLARMLRESRATHSEDQGLHVHVDGTGLRGDNAAWARFWRLWFLYLEDVEYLATGHYGYVREYNPRVDLRDLLPEGVDLWDTDPEDMPPMASGGWGRAWVNTRTSHGTVEFRLWNATRVEWRIHAAVGVSVGLVQAAVDGVTVEKDDERTLLDILGPYLTDQSYAALLRGFNIRDKGAA